MEGLLAYEDPARIIASIYVEQEHSRERERTKLDVSFYSLETSHVGDKGLDDLGTYFGRSFHSRKHLSRE